MLMMVVEEAVVTMMVKMMMIKMMIMMMIMTTTMMTMMAIKFCNCCGLRYGDDGDNSLNMKMHQTSTKRSPLASAATRHWPNQCDRD